MISVIMNQIPGNVGQYHRTPSNIGPSIPQVMFNRSAGGANLAARRANPGLISRPLGGRRKVRRSKKKRVMTSKPAEDKPSLGGWTLVQEAVIPDTPESPPPTIAPLASDPVDDKSLETATFEELETLYRTIHSELLDLESKEEEKLDEPYSPHSSDDDLLLSLRLEALKSKNSKAQNESVRSPSPMSLDSDYDDKIPIIIPLDSELEQNQPSLDSFTGRDSNNEQGYNPFHAYSSVDENRTDQNLNFSDQAESVLQKPRADDEPDPDLLREQLLKSMLNKKKMVDKTPTNQALITSRTSSPLTVITPRSPAPESMPSPKQPTISAFDSRSKSVPVPKKPSAPPFKVKPMIIYFGDDSSDDDAIKLTEKQPAANASVLASIESMLKEARRESEVVARPKVTLKKTRHSKVYKSQPVIKPKPNPLALNSIQHLPPEQQLVYMQLRRKLDRQEKLKKLADTETKYAMLKKSIPSKTTKAMLLKCKLNRKQMQVNETQKKCQEAYEAYLAADRLLGKATTELTAIKTEVRNVESEVTADKVSKVKAEQECIKLGTELKGSTYTIPSELTAKDIKEKAKSPVKRKEAPSVSVSLKRKSSRTETISQSQLDTERNRLEEMEGILRHRMEALESINKPAKGPGEKKRKLVDIKKKDKNNDTSVDERNLKELLKRLRPYLEVKELGDVLMPVKWKWNLMTYPPHFEAVDVRIQEPETETDQNLNLHTVQSNKYRSVLSHLHSYRLRNNSQDLVKSAAYANNVQPNEYICRFELSGQCTDKSCKMQHKSKYLLTDAEKVVDILLYNPSVASRNLSKDETQLRTELLEFVNLYLKKEEHNYMHLIKLVRNSDQIKNHTLPSIRRHLTRFMQKRYTFHDFSYQIKLRDRRLVLTYNKLLSMKEIPDPDLVTGTRFYMTSSFEEQAESILAENPRDTQLWIKFAYRKLRENEDDKNIRMVEALKILSRGLKHNSSDSELWENYIFLYSNCQFKTKPEKAKPKLLDICRQAVEICPTYRLWKCYVSHCFTADEKTQSSHDLIQVLVRRCLSISDDEELSHCILEAVLYRVRLHLQIGRPERAEILLRNGLVYSDLKVPPFNCALDVIKYVENCEEIQELPSRSVKTLPISKLLTVSDKVFLWISYLYLISSQRLPSYFSEPFRQSYSGIQSKDMPLLSWDHVKSETVYRTLLEAFAAAYWHCFTTETEVRTKNKFDAVSGLSANLWQLEISWRKNNAAIVDLFLELLANSKLLDLDKSRFFWSLMADAQLGAGKSTTALETIKKTKFFNSGDQSFLYLAAYISFECKDIKSLENCMRKAVRPYIDDDLSASKMADIDQVYRAVLFESSSLDVAVAEIRMKYVKYPVKSVKLWLCYIFYKILSGGSRSRISSFFTMALAMCEMVEIEEEMHLLWIAKFKYLARAVKTSSDFEEFTNQLKHCCLMTKSSLFQMKLIILFSSLIKKTSERCKFVISLSRVIPQNVDLISFAVRQCLANGEPQLVLDYLNQLINEKKQLYFNDEIWKTLIALSVDRDDHYHAHWYFETAISLYPYNAAIWDLALKYERSHGHSDHLKQLRGQYDKLKLPNATNLL